MQNVNNLGGAKVYHQRGHWHVLSTPLTMASRFNRWRKQGLWDQLLAECSGKLIPLGRLSRKSITWTALTCERISTLLGNKGDGGQTIGRSRGRFGTKIHLRVAGQGKPVAFMLTQGAVRRSEDGRPRIKPSGSAATKGTAAAGFGLSQTAGNSLHHTAENQRTTYGPFN